MGKKMKSGRMIIAFLFTLSSIGSWVFAQEVKYLIIDIFRHSGTDLDHSKACLIIMPRITYRSPAS